MKPVTTRSISTVTSKSKEDPGPISSIEKFCIEFPSDNEGLDSLLVYDHRSSSGKINNEKEEKSDAKIPLPAAFMSDNKLIF